MKIYLGHDERELDALAVAAHTLHRCSGLEAEALDAARLASHGLLWRVSDHRGGQDYDLVSNAPKSTRFAISRFLTPILCQERWALFTDCDVVFYRSPLEMLTEIEPGKAVYVVQHQYDEPTEQWKMVNQRQTSYHRKAWSSVMLFDCEHLANRRLTLWDVNHRPGRDLHAFHWLADSEIGALDPGWNWLVNVQPEPQRLGIAHFTLGGPWIPGWREAPHDELWNQAKESK